MKKKILSIILIFILSFSVLSKALADDVSDKKNQLNNSKNKIDNLKDKIDDIKDEKKDVLSDLDKLENQIKKAQGDLNSVSDQIDTTNSSIKTASIELDDAIADYNSQKDAYSERLKAMYINGPSGYLEVMLSAENFSDFISRADVVKTIAQYDKGLMLDMKSKQENIAAKKENLENKKTQLVSLQKDYSAKKANLDNANSQKEAYYSKLEKDQKSLEIALKAEEEASKLLEKQIKALLAKKNTGTFSGSTTGIVKVSDIGHIPPITSQFGNRYHPILKVYKLHTGIDIGIPSGTPVYSMADGEVIMAEYNSAYGNVVVISHGGGITSLYAHNSKLLVKEGDKVKKGQMVSKSGSTGYSTGPHLHFEVRKNGTPIDPNPYYIVGK